MKTELVCQVPAVPSNFSDEELIRYVEHYYPNLNGPLRTILNRLEARVYGMQKEVHEGEAEVQYPHCGSILQIYSEIES